MEQNNTNRKGNCIIPKYRLQNTAPCLNYNVCYHVCDPEFLKTHNNLCSDCNYLFGKWRLLSSSTKPIIILEDKHTCPICLKDNVKCVNRLSCEHYLCINCFRLIYFGYETPKPVFPYIGKENQYFQNISNNISEDWMKDKIIKDYVRDLDLWNECRYRIWNIQNKHNLTRCPDCIL